MIAFAPLVALLALNLVLAAWVSLTLPRAATDPRLGVRLPLAVFSWCVIATAVSRTPLFLTPAEAGTPPFAPLVAVPPLVILQLIAASRWTALRDALARTPAAALIAPQILRAPYGVILLAFGRHGALPHAFAQPAGRGDLIVGGTAILAALVAGRGKAGRTIAMVWNVLAAAELCLVVARGARTLIPWAKEMHHAVPIGTLPLFAVPLFLALHVWTMRALMKREA